MVYYWTVWYVISVIIRLSFAIDSVGKSVIASVNSKWNSTSLIAETSEFISRENEKLFWTFARHVAENCSSVDCASATDEQKYELSLNQASKIISEASVDLLRLSLSLRVFSPVVQLFQKIGTDHEVPCDAFFDVHGITGCQPSQLENAVMTARERDAPELLSVDHVFEFGKEADVIVIVYGEIGSTPWLQLHEKAVELATAGKSKYVLRHYSMATSPTKKISLSGYGVELAIKNTEYKAVDDTNEKKEERDEENLHGFNFKLLKELHPDSKDSLDAFRMHLKEIQELAPLKQWQVQDLSFQASQLIINSDNAIETLKQLSQDFPRHARSISRQSVDHNTRKEIEVNQKEYLVNAGMEPGESALFLNGISLDIDSLDTFQLVDLIKQEERVSTGFFNMGFKREYLSILVNMELSEEENELRCGLQGCISLVFE
ncbi:hypothetical protein KIN20_006919 [Parelaphostrongylus tenuis]|uniref:UDP-glucose:glycoprotein glucosyltransferase n=1 Tax=Parelaphostrongylus tenuis TaxID=148309 RepID=A0AAD5MNA6_PARTN|nr:hypothetical protein KIN20_006919 [Parelaphostrongylus tenuis]